MTDWGSMKPLGLIISTSNTGLNTENIIALKEQNPNDALNQTSISLLSIILTLSSSSKTIYLWEKREYATNNNNAIYVYIKKLKYDV